MTSLMRNSFSSLSLEEMLLVDDCLSSMYYLVTKANANEQTMDIEEQMTKTMQSAWQAAAAESLIKPLKEITAKPYTMARINAFAKAIGIKLKETITPAQADLLNRRITKIWTIAKKLAAKETKFKFSFSQVDRAAIKAINKQNVFWINNFYNEHLSKRIAGVSEDILLKQGLPRKEAAKVLKEAVKQEMGTIPGGPTKFADMVPKRFAGEAGVNRYFEGVAHNAAHRARSYGNLVQFNEAGVTTYRLENPMDERTGQVCQQMNGKEFSVEAATNNMEKQLQADNPEEYKEAAPWLSAGEIEKLTDEELQKAGADIPPFHYLCVAGHCLVTTNYGLVPIKDIKIGDLVLTHKGRYRPVTEIMQRSYTSNLIDFVVHSPISLTEEHPVLEEVKGVYKFKEASKLREGSKLSKIRNSLFHLWEENVCGEIEIPHKILFGGLQKFSKEESKCGKDRTKEPYPENYTYLQRMWEEIPGKEALLRWCSWARKFLQQGMQIKEPVHFNRKELHYMQEAFCSEFGGFKEGSNVFPFMQECINAYRETKARLFQRINVGKEQSNVWKTAAFEALDRDRNRAQWCCEGAGEIGTNSCRNNGRYGNYLSIRAEEVRDNKRYDIHSRFLHTEKEALDRNWRPWEVKKDKVYRHFQNNGEELSSSIQPSNAIFQKDTVKSIKRRRVVNYPVYNLEVQDDHTYTVGGIIVHNCRTVMVYVR